MSSSNKPNVLLIVIDSGRVDRFGCYGYARGTTPSIDALTRAGTVFDRMISAAPWTLPSHASLFTGLYSREHGADHPALKMSGGLLTLGEYLQRYGYETAFISNNPLVSKRWGLVDSASHVWIRRGSDPDFGSGLKNTWRRLRKLVGQSDRGSGAATQAAAELMRRASAPFFIFLNYMECHYAYLPPRPFERRFVRRPYSVLDSALSRLRMRRRRPGDRLWKDDEELELLSDLYDGSLACVDDRVGDLLEQIERLRISDDTVVIVTADHGENLGDHGQVGHDFYLHQTLLHVPFVARIPGRAPMRVQGMAQLTDVFAGLCGILDLPVPQQVAQRFYSVDPFELKPGDLGRAFAFAEWHERGGDSLERRLRRTPHYISTPTSESVQDRRYKLIAEPGSGKEWLFDLQDDPGETFDKAEEQPEERDRLRRVLEEWREVCRPIGVETPYTPQEEQALVSRLEQLGYL